MGEHLHYKQRVAGSIPVVSIDVIAHTHQSAYSPATQRRKRFSRFDSGNVPYLQVDSMIYKRCGRCGKRIPSGTTCDCYKKIKRDYSNNKKSDRFYHSSAWRKIQATVIARYKSIDLWALHHHKRFTTANTVHHIVPVKDDDRMKMDIENLIPVSHDSHSEIETLYKTGKKAQIQRELFDILERERKDRGW